MSKSICEVLGITPGNWRWRKSEKYKHCYDVMFNEDEEHICDNVAISKLPELIEAVYSVAYHEESCDEDRNDDDYRTLIESLDPKGRSFVEIRREVEK